MSTTSRSIPFSRLPRLERAKLVAKDVLARYAAAQLVLKPGVLIEATDHLDSLDLQTRLTSGYTCSVCALGAAACGIAAFSNHIKLETNDGQVYPRATAGLEEEKEAAPRLQRLFGGRVMQLVECAFEAGGSVWHYSEFDAPTENRLRDFVARYRTYEERFLAIFNEIAETGTFAP